MTAIALRLTAPLQAWASHSRGTSRPTHPAPTYSGLSGLLAGALGRSRLDAADPLAGMTVAVRIDKNPRPVWDFHTINPLPAPGDRFDHRRLRTPQMRQMSGGPYPETVITRRQYLCDSSFLCVIAGVQAPRLADALSKPRWAPFLGRKSCTPPPDLLLGRFDMDAEELVQAVPVVDRNARGSDVARQVHWLSSRDSTGEISEVWVDQPTGAVGASYQARPRTIVQGTFPSVATPKELWAWVEENHLGEELTR